MHCFINLKSYFEQTLSLSQFFAKDQQAKKLSTLLELLARLYEYRFSYFKFLQGIQIICTRATEMEPLHLSVLSHLRNCFEICVVSISRQLERWDGIPGAEVQSLLSGEEYFFSNVTFSPHMMNIITKLWFFNWQLDITLGVPFIRERSDGAKRIKTPINSSKKNLKSVTVAKLQIFWKLKLPRQFWKRYVYFLVSPCIEEENRFP